MNRLFPDVTSMKINPGFFTFQEPLKVFFLEEKVNAFIDFAYQYEYSCDLEHANLVFIKDIELASEAYRICINDLVITIYYNSDSGCFYALKTLAQILKNNKISNLEIFDQPKLITRGLMFDISRDKVPTLDTLKELVKLLSDLKMNHLELYVEGFSYEYKSFKEFLKEDDFITLEDYLKLEKYCLERYIDLVPNQNGYGHMTKWLETPKYKDLAVCPEGIFLWGRQRIPSTLNPLDERSFELVQKMYQDMIPYFQSKYFNMNFDEPFELGHGKTQGMDVGKLYLDYTLKCYKEIKKYNKTPMIWGDVLIKHPEFLNLLPKDMIFLDWGYDCNYPFKNHAKNLAEKNINFMLAPGTTSWCSFFGRFYDWYEGIKNAIDACYENNGLGVVLTDWGDFGHLQFLPISYAPIVYMGLYSWSLKDGTIQRVRDYLNKFIFHDHNEIIGDTLLDLSNYSRYEVEYSGNGTKSFYTFMWAVCSILDNDTNEIAIIDYFKQKMGNTYIPYNKYKLLMNFLNEKEKELELSSLQDNLTKEEILQSIKQLKMIQKLSLSYNETIRIDERIKLVQEIIDEKDDFLENQKTLWLKRNKAYGFNSSKKYIECFMEFALITLKYLSERGVQE